MDTGIYTETLARLYLKQGFLDQALAIYRHLAQEQPENPEWQATIATLEQHALLNALESPHLSSAALPVEPSLPQKPTPCCTTHVVIAHLERWLAAVQQRQLHDIPPGGGYHARR